MKICAAQLKPLKGDINRNIEKHKQLIEIAVSKSADLIFFPELSLTGYEPKLAKELATIQDDKRFNNFQRISNTKNIAIGVGIPTKSNLGIHISMVFFQPNKPRQTYSKQHLHSDELPYFAEGQQQVYLTLKNKKIATAICYESLLPEHSERVYNNGAEIYLASVAKSANGITKAFKHYPEIAKRFSMIVLMSNCIGPADDFVSVGKSSIWNKHGKLVGQLDETNEGVIIFDTDTEEVITWNE